MRIMLRIKVVSDWSCFDYFCRDLQLCRGWNLAMMYGLLFSLKNEIVKIAPKARVNCVAPGWVKTPMAAEAFKDPDLIYRALAT